MDDRAVYISRIDGHLLAVDLFPEPTLLEIFTQEYLWGWVLSFLARDLGLRADHAVLVVSFVIVATAAVVVWRHAGVAYLPLLLNPAFIGLAFSQIRIGLAMAILTWAFLAARSMFSPVALLALVAASSIHTSAPVFFLAMAAASWLGTGRQSSYYSRQAIGTVGAGLLAVMAFGPLSSGILSSLGDRRAQVEYGTGDSWVFYVVWVLTLVVVFATWEDFERRPVPLYGVMMLIVVLGTLLAGGYSDRFLAVGLPFAVVVLADVKWTWRSYLLLGYLFSVAARWVFWMNVA